MEVRIGIGIGAIRLGMREADAVEKKIKARGARRFVSEQGP